MELSTAELECWSEEASRSVIIFLMRILCSRALVANSDEDSPSRIFFGEMGGSGRSASSAVMF